MDSPQVSTRMHTLFTAALSGISFLLAYYIRFFLMRGAFSYGFKLYLVMGFGSAVLHYVIYSLFFYPQMNLYRRFGKLVQRTILCEVICAGLTLSFLFLVGLQNVSRLAVFISAGVSIFLISIKHYIVMRVYSTLHRSGIYQRTTHAHWRGRNRASLRLHRHQRAGGGSSHGRLYRR